MAWRKANTQTWKGKKPATTRAKKVPSGGVSLVKGSPQQEAIWQAMVGTPKHIVVLALAGTGKTFTMIEGLKRLTDAQLYRSMVFIAFNKSIADELQQKVPASVRACTCHSLLFRAYQDAAGRVDNVTDDKTWNLMAKILGSETDLWTLNRRDPTIFSNVKKLVGLVKGTLLGYDCDHEEWVGFDDAELMELAQNYGIDLNGNAKDVCRYTQQVVLMAMDRDESENIIDYDDQIWLPVVLNLQLPVFDLMCVDEAQDLNRCQQEAILRMGRRIMLVGDTNQAIYGFRGADVDSMPRMASFLGDTDQGVLEMPLTMTRRCPKKHVAMAREIVKSFEAMPEAPEGSVAYVEEEKALSLMQPGNLVICRTNAPVVGFAFRLIRQGVKANIQGRDLGQGLLSLIRKLVGPGDREIDYLMDRLEDYERKELMRLNAKKNPSESAIAALCDKCDCVRAMCDGSTRVEQVRVKVEQMFLDISTGSDKPRNFVLLSSVHRAKGLEAETTFVLYPEKMPHPMAKTPKDKQQEWNIKYVALTRSKNTMYLVPESKLKRRGVED